MPDGNELVIEGLTIQENNILIKESVDSRVEIIQKLGDLLYANGFVKDTFTQAVLDREVAFPTGLQTTVLGFAIPHTDTQHVNQPAIAIATLATPVIFQEMGNPESEVPVEIVMMLAINDPKAVVPVLRKVISILENEKALLGLRSATSKSEVMQIIAEHIRALADKIAAEPEPGLEH